MESCLTALQSEIYNSETLKKDLPGRIAITEELALYTFYLELYPRLGNAVRSRDPKTLNLAINIALEDKVQGFFIKTQTKQRLAKSVENLDTPSQTAKIKIL